MTGIQTLVASNLMTRHSLIRLEEVDPLLVPQGKVCRREKDRDSECLPRGPSDVGARSPEQRLRTVRTPRAETEDNEND